MQSLLRLSTLFLIVLCTGIVSLRSTLAAGSSGSRQGPYLLQQLQKLSAGNWARVAGLDTGLPPRVNGHDEFAAAWTKEIMKSLHGLHAGVYHQTFHTPGFRDLPASKPGSNVVVTVPGSQDPGHAVVLVAHYDGEPFSKGSAFDDASGCVVMLGVAKELGALWRSKGRPTLSVEFVLFDAEEQGLVGSSTFAFDLHHGAIMPRPVVVVDEEQSGIGYPARPFGLLSNDPFPSYAVVGEPIPSFISRYIGHITPWKPSAIKQLTNRLMTDRGSAFQRLHAVYSPLSFRGGSTPAFSNEEEYFLEIGPVSECCSDNIPFDVLGIPTATFVGNGDFYSSKPKAWSYPFDQPGDTLTAMACDTGGSPQPLPALGAALDLPRVLSVDLVSQYAPARRGKTSLSVFSSLPQAGDAMEFSVAGGGKAMWSFGDGSHATGTSATHTFKRPGSYTVTVRAGSAATSVKLSVPGQQPPYKNSFPIPLAPPRIRPWNPTELQNIAGCH